MVTAVCRSGCTAEEEAEGMNCVVHGQRDMATDQGQGPIAASFFFLAAGQSAPCPHVPDERRGVARLVHPFQTGENQ